VLKYCCLMTTDHQVVLLLLLGTAVQGQQESGGKSRFDQILSDFGFTGIAANPSKGVERPQKQPPSRPAVSNPNASGGKTSALSNLQAIASGQRGGQGLPDGSRADAFSRSLPRSQGPRPQSSRPQPSRRQPPRPQVAEDIRTNSIPQGPVRTGDNSDNALAALFKVAKSGVVAKSGAQAAPQVLNDRAASLVIPKGRAAGASNKQIISSERSLRGRGGGSSRRTESRGRGDTVARPSTASVGRQNSASQGAARTGLRSSAQVQGGQRTSAGNAAPVLSNPSTAIKPTKGSAQLQFDEKLAQFGFQPRILSGQQSKTPAAEKKAATPQRVQTPAAQSRPAQALGRPEGRRPSSQQARPSQQAQTGKSSALGNLRAIAAGANPGSFVVKNRGRAGATPTVSAPVAKTQRPARPVSFSSPRPTPPSRPAPPRRPTPPSRPIPSPKPTPAPRPAPVPRPTPRTAQAILQQQAPKAPRGSTSGSVPSSSALGNLQAIAAGEKPTLVVRNRSRGQIPGRPSPRPASSPSITPAFQQVETTAKPVVSLFKSKSIQFKFSGESFCEPGACHIPCSAQERGSYGSS